MAANNGLDPNVGPDCAPTGISQSNYVQSQTGPKSWPTIGCNTRDPNSNEGNMAGGTVAFDSSLLATDGVISMAPPRPLPAGQTVETCTTRGTTAAMAPEMARALDYTQEAIRLSSFRHFPDSVPVSATRMARAGFYYSGTGDRVICFSCGGGVEGWEYGDTAMGEHERLYPHCDFVNGRENRNKPLLPPGMFPAPVPQAAAAAAPTAGRDYADFLSPAQREKLRSKEADINDNNDNSYRQPSSNTTNLGRPDNNNPPRGGDSPDSMLTSSRPPNLTLQNNVLPNSYDIPDPGPGTPHERDIDPRHQYKSEQRRVDSYVTWPAWAPLQPRELAKAGFFYTGSDDRVQCFCCQGILRNWEAGDRAMNEHRRHFSSCPFVLNFNVGNIPIEDEDPNLPPSIPQSTPANREPTSQSSGLYQTARIHQPGLQVPTYRASRPKHPQMADEQIRLSSFHLWPSSTAVAPMHLAKAGFFYTMVADNVKCFYCDGGLRNWEPGDEPWTEHAKWFPRCEFLLQQRGDDYVQGVQARFPNLHAQQQMLQQHMRPPDEAGTGRPAPRPQASQSTLAVEMQSQVVSGVLEMGFDPNIVRNAVQQRLREHGSGYTSAHELVVAVLDLEEEEERMEHSSQGGTGAGPEEGAAKKQKELEEPAATATSAAAGASGTEEPQPGTSASMEEPAAAAAGEEGNSFEQLKKELDKYKDERTCKICMDAEVNIVFIPCGHLAVCANCAASVRRCPICRASIRGTVRTYMS
ncbi:baculoviral IAP repeat-containing protein 3-like isoform X2 [Branchiostoma floridae]|uniref:RING-type E3 ubiquitin transferase n=1 Tax=Branchiostoma floridae TaxID=7739 RepID=A0A9J7KL07_BRAFL|nr:baculoviral IAP repeat-containing protein 3-like isoform X2 [Branchiostoma floridae]